MEVKGEGYSSTVKVTDERERIISYPDVTDKFLSVDIYLLLPLIKGQNRQTDVDFTMISSLYIL